MSELQNNFKPTTSNISSLHASKPSLKTVPIQNNDIDVIAGALWRGVEQNKKTYSKMLLPRFPRDNNQKYVGYSYQNCEEWK